MSPGPAPTLLNDWITIPGFFWLILGCIAVVWLAVITIQLVRVWEENDAANEDAQDAEQAPNPQPHECDITGCHQPGTWLFDRHPHGIFYTCTPHGYMVRDWTGPYDRTVEAVYNQELDGIENYANGEAS